MGKVTNRCKSCRKQYKYPTYNVDGEAKQWYCGSCIFITTTIIGAMIAIRSSMLVKAKLSAPFVQRLIDKLMEDSSFAEIANLGSFKDEINPDASQRES